MSRPAPREEFAKTVRAWGGLRHLPAPVRSLGRLLVGRATADESWWQQEYDSVLEGVRRASPRPELPCLGVVKDRMLRHSYYEAACLELGIPYRVIDIDGADWMSGVTDGECAAFAVRPFVLTREGKAMYDDRVRIMAEELDTTVVPSVKNLWLYESKSRCAAWLAARQVAAPKTWVIHDRGKALDFVSKATYPLVFKLDIGASALGVEIVRDAQRAQALVRRCFGRGMSVPRHDPRDRQRGMALFQEFIPDAREWRVIRIGDSYFGHRKGKEGDFHSGTKLKEFETPPPRLLELAKQVTDLGRFDSMALDILEDASGKYYVLELQAYFGASRSYQMLVNGEPGRLLHNETDGAWRFEAGDFTRNAGCNLRVQHLYRQLGFETPDDWAHETDSGCSDNSTVES